MEYNYNLSSIGIGLFVLSALFPIAYNRTLSSTSRDNSSRKEDYDKLARNVQEFLEDGVTVVTNVFTKEEIERIKAKFHESLLLKGCDVSNLKDTAGVLRDWSSTGGSGGVLDIFYEEWKLAVAENPKLIGIMQKFWAHSYAACSPGSHFQHPFGKFDASKGYMYIDRVGFRVPETIATSFGSTKKKKLQRSLTPHLDCCPHSLFTSSKAVPKWRPIQCFLALTDSLQENQGGFEACIGFHKEIHEWAKTRPMNPDGSAPCVGDFSPIRTVEDRAVIERFQHIPCRAGDLVIWDYRIPHANARINSLETPREVIYLGFLPAIDVNKTYVQEQLGRFRAGLVPSDQWHEHASAQCCSYQFSELGQKLMGIREWN